MLKQQDMTETARKVFNELSNEPATVGEIAQNTYLTRERCQLILPGITLPRPAAENGQSRIVKTLTRHRRWRCICKPTER